MGILDVNAGLTGSMTQSLNTISSINRLANDSIQRINSGLKFTHASDAPVAVIKAQSLQSDMKANNSGIERNNYTLGQFDGVLTAQDSILSTVNEMKSLKEAYTAETDTDAQAVLAEKYTAYANSLDTLAAGATFNGTAVLGSGGSTESINTFATGGTTSIAFEDMTLSGLGLSTAIATDTIGDIDTAVGTVTKNSGLVSASRDVFEKANSIMSSSNTAWAQSYNELVAVNDAEESALLTSLSNRASAASAAMSYQSKFYNLSSGVNMLA